MNVDVRRQIAQEEFDYQTLLSVLSGYASPRDRITGLLREGVIIRVKKGLYVFGESYRRRPFCRELLANLIYGPSFVSLDYALGYYGLIPERVEVVTSVTAGRARRFETPVGLFSYLSTPNCSFGVDQLGEETSHFLMAVPERALADKLRAARHVVGRTHKEMAQYLFEDLRLDESDVREMSAGFLDNLADVLRSRKIRTCAALVRSMRMNG